MAHDKTLSNCCKNNLVLNVKIPAIYVNISWKMKVTFRKVREGDLKRLNEIINDVEANRFLNTAAPVSMKSTRDFFNSLRKDERSWYAVLADGVVVGGIILNLHGDKTKRSSHVASIGINLAREYWGMGVGDKAIKFLTGLARKHKVKRFELQYIEGNERARRLYEKNGFKKEGVRKKAFKLNGRYYDSIVMAKFLK